MARLPTSCWSTARGLTALLEWRHRASSGGGYTVTAPQFPLTSLADDVARLRQVLARQAGATVVPDTPAAARS